MQIDRLRFLCLGFFCFLVCLADAQNQAPTHAVDGESIKEWLLLGPIFPDDWSIGVLSPRADFLAHVGGEANIRPKEGDTVTTKDGRTLSWKRYTSKEKVIDLHKAVGYHKNAIAYAFCFLQSEVAGDIGILLGGIDGAAVWIDGKRMYWSCRETINDGGETATPNRLRFEVNLKAGKSPCLVKVATRKGDWELAMRAL
ncbi:hypothetical protein IH992_12860, partial [Candidatus Poribacteria bacterium]|nr:hypothetical protein [Candidatus Poribacteria bacterium]